MPYFHFAMDPRRQPAPSEAEEDKQDQPSGNQVSDRIRIKNRRKRYLDTHPEYFGASLELADPLLYDRLIRRFQSTTEREEEGRQKGYSGVLEADLLRAEAKISAIANPDPNSIFTYRRGPDGEILAEEADEVPDTKEDGQERWRYEMEQRFLRGDDNDFDYDTVDENEDLDDWAEEDRQRQEEYFDKEEPHWAVDDGRTIIGETGIQDF
ncbi:hypothetical protein P152DRAFT_133743 [Eremomyces bilateralis CBS 781.70]|uniref:CCD97-like C-terminal domain-containing protein n=1 Tax=Eremomyces bilateralis CBS 781.70 TaxID=1392243 RepID=A0A6G1GF44_9PEZI|nr:uncharacterized protein P152DRAFT_133743 [Eremomyces bilateralis CBS 781.70]KAF1816688.1 hypothetical protein P152DRAFT_133743 [Eremomyces bilateralis CBS 781.70]